MGSRITENAGAVHGRGVRGAQVEERAGRQRVAARCWAVARAPHGREVRQTVAQGAKAQLPREAVLEAVGKLVGGIRRPGSAMPRATIPYPDEPWFC
ncbi:MAG: hypothetical protein ACRD1Y_14175 [Terriglobales bacterium]